MSVATRMGLRRARPALLLALVSAAALSACRQTVILDPSASSDGGRAGAGFPDAAGGGGGKADGGGGAGGSAGSMGNRDGGRPDIGFCFGGPIQPIPITLRAPDLILAVDRSASMQSWFGSGTRLQVIQGQVLGLVLKYQMAVRFGYVEFPSSSGMCNNGLGCCAGEVAPPKAMSLNAIQHVMNDCDNANGNACVQAQRPLADALSRCERTFGSLNPTTGRGRYLIVLAGGEPTCGGNADGGASACDTAAKVVTDLSREQDVSTAIFGVGDEAIGNACLDKLALLGGLGSVNKSPVFRLALTPTELSQSLGALVRTIAEEACHIDVLSPPADPTNVQMLIGNMRVPMDGVDGWTFDPGSAMKITVHGGWCDALIQQMGRNPVELLSGCAPRP